jgi:hypothetical protein
MGSVETPTLPTVPHNGNNEFGLHLDSRSALKVVSRL